MRARSRGIQEGYSAPWRQVEPGSGLLASLLESDLFAVLRSSYGLRGIQPADHEPLNNPFYV
jgi:hypothetical protein